MAKKPTVADAQLIVQLYDLRRESEMRKARAWWTTEFFPETADDFLKVAWDMVSSFVNSRVLHEELFLAPGFSGELFLIYAKIHPFMTELRQKLNDAQAFQDVETAVTSTQWGRDRLEFMIKRVANLREKRKAASGS